jgi:hypothetical protein
MVALAIGVLAVVIPGAALTARTAIARRDEASRSPGGLLLAAAGVLAALVGTVAWRGRDRVASAARDAAAGIEGVAQRFAGDEPDQDLDRDVAAATWPASGEHVAA